MFRFQKHFLSFPNKIHEVLLTISSMSRNNYMIYNKKFEETDLENILSKHTTETIEIITICDTTNQKFLQSKYSNVIFFKYSDKNILKADIIICPNMESMHSDAIRGCLMLGKFVYFYGDLKNHLSSRHGQYFYDCVITAPKTEVISPHIRIEYRSSSKIIDGNNVLLSQIHRHQLPQIITTDVYTKSRIYKAMGINTLQFRNGDRVFDRGSFKKYEKINEQMYSKYIRHAAVITFNEYNGESFQDIIIIHANQQPMHVGYINYITNNNDPNNIVIYTCNRHLDMRPKLNTNQFSILYGCERACKRLKC